VSGLKIIVGAWVGFLVGAGLVYLGVAFVVWSWNPQVWAEGDRFAVAVLGGCLGALGAMIGGTIATPRHW
jgi:hypothetical protein